MVKRTLPISLLPSEAKWGRRYLLFSLFFLGSMISSALPRLLPGLRNVHLNTVYFAINFSVVVWIFRRFLLKSLLIVPGKVSKVVIGVVAGLILYFSAMTLVEHWIQILVPGFINGNDRDILQNWDTDRILTILGPVFLVPLVEETLHRGLVFGSLHRKSPVLAYVISALLFCFIHVPTSVYSEPLLLLIALLQYLPAGLLLAGAYDFSGTVITPIIMHTVINTVAVILLR